MNKIEQDLNRALESAREKAFVAAFSKNAISVGKNLGHGPECIMFEGLTGSGKTAMIRAWAEKKKDEINFVEFDASNLIVYTVDGESIVFSSAEIELMSKDDTVVFIDNYQYMRKDTAQQINRLLDDKIVRDPANPKEEKTLEKILMVVAARTI